MKHPWRVLLAAGVLAIVAGGAAHAAIWNIDAGGAFTQGGTTNFTFSNVSEPGTILDIDVRFSASETRPRDLTVSLKPPDSAGFVELFSNIGSPNTGADHFQDTYIDDEGTGGALSQSTLNPLAGPEWGGTKYQPEGGNQVLHNGFDGHNPNGQWILRVVDNNTSGSGTLWKAGQTAPWGTAIGTQLIITAVPEASTFALFGVGLLGLVGYGWRRRKQRT